MSDSKSTQPVILWIRQALRLHDNTALQACVESKRPIIPVYIYAEHEAGDWATDNTVAGASMLWLTESLKSLSKSYAEKGSQLILRIADQRQTAKSILANLIEETGASTIVFDERYEPWARTQENAVKAFAKEAGVGCHSIRTNFLFHPDDFKTGSGGPYKVFTPFYKRCKEVASFSDPLPIPHTLYSPDSWPKSDSIDAIPVEKERPWIKGILENWTIGEKGARKQLARFVTTAVGQYPNTRDNPSVHGTSTLSPYLHFGEISPRQVWSEVSQHAKETLVDSNGAQAYLRQIIWREFAQVLLYHFPHTPEKPLKEKFENFPWEDDKKIYQEYLSRWQRGQTGYPIVDAGMRELWHTGWMHNRVRMIAASVLIKHLLIPWQEGERWFWDTLVDADLANNAMGWQWVAGSGADASPYFRIFNPFTQGEKFDISREYVRKWVPEIANLSDKYIYRPWEAKPLELEAAGIRLGETYPHPIVDHFEARDKALAGYKAIKGE